MFPGSIKYKIKVQGLYFYKIMLLGAFFWTHWYLEHWFENGPRTIGPLLLAQWYTDHYSEINSSKVHISTAFSFTVNIVMIPDYLMYSLQTSYHAVQYARDGQGRLRHSKSLNDEHFSIEYRVIVSKGRAWTLEVSNLDQKLYRTHHRRFRTSPNIWTQIGQRESIFSSCPSPPIGSVTPAWGGPV